MRRLLQSPVSWEILLALALFGAVVTGGGRL
jgi:hypothetical protein